jgi:magnesium chelatase subunit I
MKGADVVVREIIRTAILHVYDQYFAETITQQIEQWFNLGGSVKIEDSQSAKATLAELQQIQGLFEKLSPLGVSENDAPEKIVAAAEFLLEGLYAHKKLSRSEERGFSAQERARAGAERSQERRDESREYEQWQQRRSNKQRSGLN